MEKYIYCILFIFIMFFIQCSIDENPISFDDSKANIKNNHIIDQEQFSKSMYASSTQEDYDIDVVYRVHVKNDGWLGWVSNGQQAGTTGEAKRIESIQICLSNVPSNYSIRYDVLQQQDILNWNLPDWQDDWSYDGEEAGVTGKGLRIEMLRIELCGATPSNYYVRYKGHIQGTGWSGWSYDGENAGKSSKRLEAVKIEVRENAISSLNINGKTSNPINIRLNESIILNGSSSKNAVGYFVSVQRSDASWSRYGTAAMRWLNADEVKNIKTFDIRKFCNERGLALTIGQYYRVKLAVSYPWNEKTKLIRLLNY